MPQRTPILNQAGTSWTVEELAQWGGVGGLGPVFVGSPSTVADILQEWVEETDVDGSDLAYAVTPEIFEDVVNFLVPELQKRGAYPTGYRPGTLREKLFGEGPYLPSSRPAAAYRDIRAVKRKASEAAGSAHRMPPRVAPYAALSGHGSSRCLARLAAGRFSQFIELDLALGCGKSALVELGGDKPIVGAGVAALFRGEAPAQPPAVNDIEIHRRVLVLQLQQARQFFRLSVKMTNDVERHLGVSPSLTHARCRVK